MFKGSCKKRIIFSIIIPLYNKEKFISKTLQSVLSQLDIFELIIINDSSTDNSLKICKKFKKKNKLIKIINPKRKLYVSEARNLGIKKSSGEYLIFLDADDIIGKNFLKNLNNIIKNNKYDLIINDLGDLRKGKSYSFKNNFIKKLILSKFVGYCWRNIYRRNFLNKNNIYFKKNILVCEDEEFVSRCFLKSRKIHFLDKNYYHKTSEPKSLSHVNLGQNFYGLDLENFLKSYLNVLISLSRNLKKIKNNKPLKFYFQNRIKLMLNKIYPLIMLSDDIQLKNQAFVIDAIAGSSDGKNTIKNSKEIDEHNFVIKHINQQMNNIPSLVNNIEQNIETYGNTNRTNYIPMEQNQMRYL